MVVGPHEVVAGSFACRIRTVGFISAGFLKSGRLRRQRAINLVSRDVQKAERLPGFTIQGTPVTARGLEKAESTDDIGLDEVFGAVNGTVNMTLGGKIEDGARPVAPE